MVTGKPENEKIASPEQRNPAEIYRRRVAGLKAAAEKDESARAILELAGKLNEANVLALQRLAEIFGLPLLAEKVDEALALHREAQEKGEALAEKNTAVATKKGQLRAPGGVFFYLMARHVRGLGLNWEGLRLPQLPGNEFFKPRPARAPKAEPALPDKIETVELPATPVADVKPARARVNLTGTPLESPHLNPQGIEDLVELVFSSEMSPTLPKGLPNLGATRVIVWCTRKQYDRVKADLKPDSRLVVEGELSVGVSREMTPFARVICTKLSTVEMEQSRQRAKGSPGKSSPNP